MKDLLLRFGLLAAVLAIVSFAGCSANNRQPKDTIDKRPDIEANDDDKGIDKEALINSLSPRSVKLNYETYKKIPGPVLKRLITNKDTGYYIVQYKDNARKEWLDEIQKLGGIGLGDYYRGHGALYKIDPANREDVAKLEFVARVYVFENIFKLSPDMIDQFARDGLSNPDRTMKLKVIVFENIDEVIKQIEELGGKIDSTDRTPNRTGTRIRADIAVSKIIDILQNPYVKYVNEYQQKRIGPPGWRPPHERKEVE